MRGATLGAIVSSIYCKPYGIQETTFAVSFAVFGELIYHTIFPIKHGDDGTSTCKDEKNKKSAVVVSGSLKRVTTTRTRPSFNIWIALVASWIGLGIALDSHHYHTYTSATS